MSNESGLTVGQVAARAGIAASAVRYYESIGLLPPAERVGGWRRFPPAVLDRLRLIAVGTQAGFSLAEVGVLVAAVDGGEPGPQRLVELARAKLPELEANLARLQGMVKIMRAAAVCRCPTLAECVDLVGPSRDSS